MYKIVDITANTQLADIKTPKVGLGCMGMSEFYGTQNDTESLAALHHAYDLGYRHFDTADMYGNGANEQLLNRFLTELGSRRNDILVATKVGIRRNQAGSTSIEIDSSPAHVRAACEQSLRRLGVEQIGLLYLHRKTPTIPIEETMDALQSLVREGKIRHIGLSEVSATTLTRACQAAPIAALQNEYSLWSRDPENDILDVCRRFQVQFVAYAPLGRGFLTGTLKAETVAQAGDLRGHLPRFQQGNFERNASLLDVLRTIAAELDYTPAQVALAWVLSAWSGIHVIPGSTKPANLAANIDSLRIHLSPQHRQQLSQAFHAQAIQGERYPAALLHTVNL